MGKYTELGIQKEVSKLTCTALVSLVSSNNQKHLAACVYAFALLGTQQMPTHR